MFDFIVVGAGSAGCVIAEGLSARHSVLLIEAGNSNRKAEVTIPAAFSKQFDTDLDWGFHSEPEKGASGRRLYIPLGRGLGGSSSMNAMIYMRGRPSDYDGWADDGASGWEWETVAPIFRRMESNTRGESVHHGSGGPVLVDDLRDPNPFTRRFIEAAIEVGIPANADFNGDTQEGVGFYQVTQKRGRRWSAADAYLEPAATRPTLTIASNAVAHRLIVEGDRVKGLEYVHNNKRKTASCGGEVILAAGAIGSPHLLQLSGIGDPEHLRSIGIQPRFDNPHVGQHLQDHMATGIAQASKKGGTLDDAETTSNLVKWMLTRRGPLSSNIAEAGAFVRSDPAKSEPDLQFHFGPAYFVNHGREPAPGPAYTLGPVLINPTARGSVVARSSDPAIHPAILGNFLGNQSDIRALVAGMAVARQIHAASSFDDVRGEELLPGPEVTSETGIESFVRERAETFYHPVGTCRMGKPGGSVVDPQLRVHGMAGLRVADASVMPTITSGNTHAPSMMIGARAVEFILASR